MKDLLVLVGAVIAANYVTEKFVLRTPEKPTGFVDVDDSPFGMDDFARAGITVVAIWGAKKLLGKVGG